MEKFEFSSPLYLLLIPPFLAMLWFYFRAGLNDSEAAYALPSIDIIKVRRSFRTLTYRYLPVLRVFSILLIIIALAGPGRGIHYSTVKSRGIDIMITLDLSASMMGEDFQPKNRLEVAKQVIAGFISRRKPDRIGLVVFAGEAYLQAPLTLEHEMISDIVEELNFSTVEVDGTAIGDAVALSASRMAESPAKSRIILLLTDGVNNRGTLDPATAAKICAETGIKIYTVGIGKEGRVPYPVQGGIFGGKRYIENHFDESSLRDVSEITGGVFYRAESGGVLWEQVQEIDMLEKSDFSVNVYHEFHDRSEYFLAASALLFFIELILKSLYYRKLP